MGGVERISHNLPHLSRSERHENHDQFPKSFSSDNHGNDVFTC
jgi:hypothetical protein